MTVKERLRELIDALPEPEQYAALRYVEFLQQQIGGEAARLDNGTSDWSRLSAQSFARDWDQDADLYDDAPQR